MPARGWLQGNLEDQVNEMSGELVKVETVFEQVQAELLRGLLEAQGVRVMLSQEGAAKALGLAAGALAEIEIFVAEEDTERARQVLAEYYGGELESDNPEE